MTTYIRTVENGNIFVGVDIHKQTWYVYVVKTIWTLSVNN